MKVPAIDEPISLGRPFLVVYLLAFGPWVYVAKPYEWGPPWYVELSGLVLPPFLIAMVLYCSVLFVISISRHFFAQSSALLEFSAAIIGPAVFAFVTWRFSSAQMAPAVCAFAASFLAYSGLFLWIRKKLSNQSPDRMAPSVTPPASASDVLRRDEARH